MQVMSHSSPTNSRAPPLQQHLSLRHRGMIADRIEQPRPVGYEGMGEAQCRHNRNKKQQSKRHYKEQNIELHHEELTYKVI